ncbi:MAG: hypothetical protein M3Y64_06930 [Gemmatimonadota bacterium]|nr:hypothetical protein [Gemmatimonadota bacterium]
MTAFANTAVADSTPQFGAVLAEAQSELDDAEARDEAFAHVARLSFAAHQALLEMIGGHLPRPGGYAYSAADAPLPQSPTPALDIRH